MVRPHNCKRCAKKVCWDCGKTRRRVITYTIDPKDPHKVCLRCKHEVDFLYFLYKVNQVKFARNSLLGQYWVSISHVAEKKQSSSMTYEQYKNLFKPTDPLFHEDDVQIKKDVDGRTDRTAFGVGFQEALFYAQEGRDEKEFRQNVKNVLMAFSVRHPHIGYTQGMNLIVAFLLCFNDEEDTFWLFIQLVENILGVNYYERSSKGNALSGYMMEKYIIHKLMSENFMLPKEEQDNLEMFLNIYSAQMLIPVFINYLNFEATVNVWNLLFERQSILELDRVTMAFLKVLLNDTKDLFNIRNTSDMLGLIQKNVTWNMIVAELATIDVKEEQRNYFREQHLSEMSSEWNKGGSHQVYRLSKITHFNKNEISSILDEFSKMVDVKNLDSDKKVGLTHDDFIHIMTTLMEIPELKSRLTFLHRCSLTRLYEILDDGKTGKLDFREVLWSLSVLSRGTPEEKISLLFYLHDSNSKNYLLQNELEDFLDCLCDILVTTGLDGMNVSEEDVLEFKERVLTKFADKTSLTYPEIHTIRQDTLFKRFEELCQSAERKNTCLSLAQSFKLEAARRDGPRNSRKSSRSILDGEISSGDEDEDIFIRERTMVALRGVQYPTEGTPTDGNPAAFDEITRTALLVQWHGNLDESTPDPKRSTTLKERLTKSNSKKGKKNSILGSLGTGVGHHPLLRSPKPAPVRERPRDSEILRGFAPLEEAKSIVDVNPSMMKSTMPSDTFQDLDCLKHAKVDETTVIVESEEKPKGKVERVIDLTAKRPVPPKPRAEIKPSLLAEWNDQQGCGKGSCRIM